MIAGLHLLLSTRTVRNLDAVDTGTGVNSLASRPLRIVVHSSAGVGLQAVKTETDIEADISSAVETDVSTASNGGGHAVTLGQLADQAASNPPAPPKSSASPPPTPPPPSPSPPVIDIPIRRSTDRLRHSPPTPPLVDEPSLLIHNTDPWAPHLHADVLYETRECTCPEPPPPPLIIGTANFRMQLRRPPPNPKMPAPIRLEWSPDRPPSPLAAAVAETYVINLPNRTDRRHYMCSLLRHLNLPVTFWPAFPKVHPTIHAYAHQQPAARYNPRLTYVFEYKNRPHVPRMKEAEIACWASHREVWHNVVLRRIERPILVMEDDVDLEVAFGEAVANALAALPSDWAVLWIGHCFEDLAPHNATTRVAHRLHHALRPTCTHAYALRDHRAAAHLLEHLGHDLAMSVDIAMMQLVTGSPSELPAYVMLPPPITQLYRSNRSRKGTPSANPSDVNVHGMKLPLQKIVHSARDAVLQVTLDAESAAAGGEARLASEIVEPSELPPGLCRNELFLLRPPDDAPGELATYPPEEYLPRR